MPDSSFDPAFICALREHEIGNTTPYKISFAKLGRSGASFGSLQGDLYSGPAYVKTTFRQVLWVGGVGPQEVIDGLLARLSVQLRADPLGSEEEAAIDRALSSAAGRPLVDAMDERLLQACLGKLDACITAAHASGRQIAPVAQIAIMLWANMISSTDQLRRWLSGQRVRLNKLVPPPNEYVTLPDMLKYVASSKYYCEYPDRLNHFQYAVAVGERQLPAPPVFVAAFDTSPAADFEYYIYQQASGCFWQHTNQGNTKLGCGYAGSYAGNGRNNPDKQCEPFVGPLPRGYYQIGYQKQTPTRLSLPLTPYPSNDMCGRGNFLIHGDCINDAGNASTGCIILNFDIRYKIFLSNIKTLLVVAQ